DDIAGVRFGHVLDHVSGQHRVERVRLGVSRGEEVLDRVCLQTLGPAGVDRAGVVVDPDAVAAQVREVSPDATAHVEPPAQLQPADVPPVGRLHVDHLLPPRTAQPLQPLGVVEAFGAGAWHGCGVLHGGNPTGPRYRG